VEGIAQQPKGLPKVDLTLSLDQANRLSLRSSKARREKRWRKARHTV